jgi:gas vesicle protein
MKKQFDIKYRPQIESGEYKVETRDGRPVRIVCWDRIAKEDTDDDLNLCVLVPEDGGEAVYYYHQSGKKYVPDKAYDLFIITPEPELSEFEKKLSDVVGYAISLSVVEPQKPTSAFVKEYAAELIALAREQFIKDGYVIEKKAFHDAVKKVSPEVMKAVSENVDKANKELTEFEKVLGDIVKEAVEKEVGDNSAIWAICRGHAEKLLALAREELFANDTVLKEYVQMSREHGKAEALRTRATELTENLVKSGLDKDSIPYNLIEFMCNLYTCPNWKEIEEIAEAYATRLKDAAMKELPKWRKIDRGNNYSSETKFTINGRYLEMNDTLNDVYEAPLSALEKLPRLKEDEK